MEGTVIKVVNHPQGQTQPAWANTLVHAVGSAQSLRVVPPLALLHTARCRVPEALDCQRLAGPPQPSGGAAPPDRRFC